MVDRVRVERLREHDPENRQSRNDFHYEATINASLTEQNRVLIRSRVESAVTSHICEDV
jgi:hypothetical protein